MNQIIRGTMTKYLINNKTRRQNSLRQCDIVTSVMSVGHDVRDAWCVKHGKTCSVQDKIADVHVAGTTCCAFSAIGDGQGESAMSHAHFLVWCGQRAVLQEPIIIQENVVAFPREALMLMLPMYEWVFGVLDPVQLGWPIRRERQFMMRLTFITYDICVLCHITSYA